VGTVLIGPLRQFALPVALVATVGAGILVTAAFARATARAESPGGDIAGYAARVAAHGLEEAIARGPEALDMPAGEASEPVVVFRSGDGSLTAAYRIRWWALSDGELVLLSEGRVTVDGESVIRTVQGGMPGLPGAQRSVP
jgi:hypothetical protein